MKLRCLGAIALFALVSTSSAAFGQAPGQQPTTLPPPTPQAGPTTFGPPVDTVVTKRYGHHILLADGLAIAATFGTQEPTFALSYFVTGPIVHIAHGNPGRALGSLALRAGAPLTGAMVGLALGSGSCGASQEGGDEFCGLAGFLVGGVAGMVTAAVIDASVMAKKSVRVAPPRLVPVASVTKAGTMQLGLAGRF